MIDLNHKHITRAARNAGSAIGKYSLVKNFEKDSASCWNYMKVVRGSALCSICSGRSEVFFKENKALISLDTCLKAVGSCEGFFLTLVDLAKALEAYNQNKPSGITKEEKERMNQLQIDLKKFHPPQTLVKSFQHYNKIKEKPDQAKNEAIRICSMIMNIRKAPFILVMNREGVSRVMAIIKKKLELAKSKETEEINRTTEERLKNLENFRIKNNLTETDASIIEKKAKILKFQHEKLRRLDQVLKKRKSNLNRKVKTLQNNWNKKNQRKLLSISEALTNLEDHDESSPDPSEENDPFYPTLDSQVFISDTLVFDALNDASLSVVVHGSDLHPMNMSLKFP